VCVAAEAKVLIPEGTTMSTAAEPSIQKGRLAAALQNRDWVEGSGGCDRRIALLRWILINPALALGSITGDLFRLDALSITAPSPALCFGDSGTTGLRPRARR
jgi:hypothetical protein